MRRSHLLPAMLACVCCDYNVLSTEVGEHVVYHWDSSERQLCRGTAKAADRFVESIPAYYGRPFGGVGPKIEYFWDDGALARSACAVSFVPTASDVACMLARRSSFAVLAAAPLHTHELAHTAEGGNRHPSIIVEGFATRWESALIDRGPTLRTAPHFLSEAEFRAQLHLSQAELDETGAQMGAQWWIALETHFGPAKVGEFIVELGKSAAAENVDVALQAALGITLAESVVLAANLPELTIDDPACEFRGVPTFVWSGETLTIEREDARCKDDDIINLASDRVIWLFALEFPESGGLVDVHVNVPFGSADPQRSGVNWAACDGDVNIGAWSSVDYHSARYPDADPTPRYMSGHYVAALVGVIETNGSISFPHTIIEEPQP
jgi:hypothetical protein